MVYGGFALNSGSYSKSVANKTIKENTPRKKPRNVYSYLRKVIAPYIIINSVLKRYHTSAIRPLISFIFFKSAYCSVPEFASVFIAPAFSSDSASFLR